MSVESGIDGVDASPQTGSSASSPATTPLAPNPMQRMVGPSPTAGYRSPAHHATLSQQQEQRVSAVPGPSSSLPGVTTVQSWPGRSMDDLSFLGARTVSSPRITSLTTDGGVGGYSEGAGGAAASAAQQATAGATAATATTKASSAGGAPFQPLAWGAEPTVVFDAASAPIRGEVVALISGWLRDNGFPMTLQVLREEAGMQRRSAHALRKAARVVATSVAEGSFDQAYQAFLRCDGAKDDRAAHAALAAQQFLELVEAGDSQRAFHCFLKRLKPLEAAMPPRDFARLAYLLSCRSVAEGAGRFPELAAWTVAAGRAALAARLAARFDAADDADVSAATGLESHSPLFHSFAGLAPGATPPPGALVLMLAQALSFQAATFAAPLPLLPSQPPPPVVSASAAAGSAMARQASACLETSAAFSNNGSIADGAPPTSPAGATSASPTTPATHNVAAASGVVAGALGPKAALPAGSAGKGASAAFGSAAGGASAAIARLLGVPAAQVPSALRLAGGPNATLPSVVVVPSLLRHAAQQSPPLQPVAVLEARAAVAACQPFLSSGLVAVGFVDGGVALWSLAAGGGACDGASGRLTVLGRHAARVWAMAALPPTGGPGGAAAAAGGPPPLLATSGADGAVLLWDVAARCLVQRFGPHAAADVFAVAFGPWGSRCLASGGYGGEVALWELPQWVSPQQQQQQRLNSATPALPSSEALCRLKLPYASAVVSLCFSRHGSTLYVLGKDGTARVVDLASGVVTREWGPPLPADASCLALSPTCQSVLVAYKNDALRLWDAVTGALAPVRLTAPGTNVRRNFVRCAFADRAECVVAGSEVGTVLVWDLCGVAAATAASVPGASDDAAPPLVGVPPLPTRAPDGVAQIPPTYRLALHRGLVSDVKVCAANGFSCLVSCGEDGRVVVCCPRTGSLAAGSVAGAAVPITTTGPAPGSSGNTLQHSVSFTGGPRSYSSLATMLIET